MDTGGGRKMRHMRPATRPATRHTLHALFCACLAVATQKHSSVSSIDEMKTEMTCC